MCKKQGRDFIRRYFLIALTGILILTCWGIGTSWGQAKSVKIAFLYSEESHHYLIAKWGKEYIEEKSNGRFKVDMFHSAKLGSEEAMFSQMKMGSIDMAILSSPGYADPLMNITCAPFVFRDLDHYYKVFDGPIGKEISDTFEKKTGVYPIYYTYRVHQLIFTTKPLINRDDWKKFKIRTATAPCWTSQVTACGGNVVPMPYTETYMGLKTGVIDGVQTVLGAFYDSKFYEVTKYAIDIKHDFSPDVVLINSKFLRSLPPNDQNIFIEAFRHQKEKNRQWVDKRVDFLISEITKHGVKVYTAPDDDVEYYRKNFEKYMESNSALFGGKSIYEKIRNLK